MTATLQPDICVIGASEAGRSVAIGALAMGCSVAVVDGGDPSGCSNRDLTLELLRTAARSPGVPPEAAWSELRAGLRRAAAERSHARLAAMNIRVIPTDGRFRDPETLEAGSTAVRARRFVIATGRARAENPDFPESQRLHTLPSSRARPDRVDLLGGSPDMVAATLSLAGLGTAVTLEADALLPDIDAELAAPLLARLRQHGICVTARGQDPSGAGPHFAEPLSPSLSDLALERAAVAQTGSRLVLTAGLRTTNPRVFAVGCPAGARSTAAGVAQAGLILRGALLRLPVRPRPDLVPTIVLADPELAQVGLTEERARLGGVVQVWRWPLGQTGPGFAAGAASGHLKVVTDRRGRVLGAGIIGPQARELIGFWTLAVARRLTLADLAEVPVASPSWSESVRGIVLGNTASRLTGPWVRRSLALARRLI